jgi:lipoyl synthase
MLWALAFTSRLKREHKMPLPYRHFPDWLKKKPPKASALMGMKKLTSDLGLHTICESALCPNQWECFSSQIATFLILGDTCTRRCAFCAVKKGIPQSLNPDEPDQIVKAVAKLSLQYVVITSVTRDDLPDGGAGHFAAVVEAIREYNPEIKVEVLTPDFGGSFDSLTTVLASVPFVYNHNIETVPRLYPDVRPGAVYERSIELLQKAKAVRGNMHTKSGVMLGMGENPDEVEAVMKDLLAAGCDVLTLGQYLQPTKNHHAVVKFIAPVEFDHYKKLGEQMGFKLVLSGPFVRSSFHASDIVSLKRQTNS